MLSDSPPSTARESRVPWPFFCLLHVALPSLGAVVVTSVLLSLINTYVPYPTTTLLEVIFHPWHPIQIGAMLLLGYIVPRELPRSSLARWAWVIPTVYFLLRIAWWYHESAAPVSVLADVSAPRPDVWAHFFGPCVDRFALMTPQAGCLDQFTATLPFQASVAYSVGALLDQFGVFRFQRVPQQDAAERGKEPAPERRALMKDTLQITAPTDREIVMTRVFNAPCHLVFEALTKPELVQRWLLGPEGWTMPVCEIDLRVGGSFRYLWRHANRPDMGMRGVYREISSPERIVHTELFDEDWTGGETLVTSALVEQDGKTTLTTTVLYASRQVRDMVLKSGMEQGVAASYDRLEKMLPSLGS